MIPEKEDFEKVLARSFSSAEVALHYGVSVATVSRWIRRYGVWWPRRQPIPSQELVDQLRAVIDRKQAELHAANADAAPPDEILRLTRELADANLCYDEMKARLVSDPG